MRFPSQFCEMAQEFVEFLEEEAGIAAPPDSQQSETEKPSPTPRAKQKPSAHQIESPSVRTTCLS